MKNEKLNSIMIKGAGIITALGAGFSAIVSHAAADTDLTTALASTTSIFTDNKGTIFTFLVGAFGVALVIALALRAMNRGGGMVKGALGGGRRRR